MTALDTHATAVGHPPAATHRSPPVSRTTAPPRCGLLVRALVFAVLFAASLVSTQLHPASADEPLRELKWADLVPPAAAAPPKPALRSFLAGRPATSSPDHTSIPEGRWLSPGAQASQTGAGSGPPAVVEELNDKRVKIGGYIVPLDFDATTIKEFLLVPFVGACIHVPPPPPNQIVYVTSDTGIDVKGVFDPVWVTGKLATKVAFTGLAEAGYSLTAEQVEARPE